MVITGGGQPDDRSPATARERSAEHELIQRDNPDAIRHLADYRRGDQPNAVRNARPQPPGSDGDAYNGVFFRTWHQARSTASHHQARADAAAAALPAARAALQAAMRDADELRGELGRTYPWQRRRRAQLRELIGHARETAQDRRQTVNDLEATASWSRQLCHTAARVADLLHHQDQAAARPIPRVLSHPNDGCSAAQQGQQMQVPAAP